MNGQSQNTNTHFQHSLSTKANPSVIWKIWTDVAEWPRWDQGLKAASMKGPFQLGAKGRLVPDKGPKSRFKITQFEEGRSYTMRTNLPLGSLEIHRYLKQKDGQWYFTHEVRFRGLLKNWFGKKFGERYRKLLPEVMQSIEEIAESHRS